MPCKDILHGSRLAVLPLLSVLLAGCYDDTFTRSAALTPPQFYMPPVVPRHEDGAGFKVVSAGRTMLVGLSPAGLSFSDRTKLATMIADIARGRPDLVHITVETGAGDPEQVRPLSAMLQADGVLPENIQIRVADETGGGGMTAKVSARRYYATLPGCLDVKRLSAVGPSNDTSGDWGCSADSALAAMVADPGDLVSGRAGGHTDSAYAAKAVDRFDNDKVFPYIPLSVQP